MKLPLIAASIALAVAMAGCGGGGGLSGALQPATQASSNTAPSGTYTVSTIVVPGGAGSASNARRAEYISPSSLGLKVTVTDIPPTGSTAAFTPIVTTYALTLGPNSITVPTPATATGHTEDITYVAYNQAPVANAIPGAAKAVAWGLSTGLTILPGANSNSLALSGVVDTFPAPLAETGSFGTMTGSSGTFAYAGAQTTLGFGGSGTGVATLLDAGTNNIATADGATTWSVVGAIPAAATTVASGVTVTSVETAGTCGAIGVAPHLQLAFGNGPEAATSAITDTTDALKVFYDGLGGAGWYATVTAKAQSASLVYTVSSLAVTSINSGYNCTKQTLAFNQFPSATPAVMNIAQHVAATPYTVTVPANCSPFVNVYIGPVVTGTLIPAGTSASLGAFTDFTVQEAASVSTECLIEIQDANAANVTGANNPGGTTYIAVLPPGYTQSLTVP